MYGVMVNRSDTDEILEWLRQNDLREIYDWTRTIVPGASKMRISFHNEEYAFAFAAQWTDENNNKQENAMTTYNVELDADTVDNIIVDQLCKTRSSLLQDYEKGTTGVFDFDPAEDRRQIAAVIKALETVIDWYSVPGSNQFDELQTFTYGEEDA